MYTLCLSGCVYPLALVVLGSCQIVLRHPPRQERRDTVVCVISSRVCTAPHSVLTSCCTNESRTAQHPACSPAPLAILPKDNGVWQNKTKLTMRQARLLVVFGSVHVTAHLRQHCWLATKPIRQMVISLNKLWSGM